MGPDGTARITQGCPVGRIPGTFYPLDSNYCTPLVSVLPTFSRLGQVLPHAASCRHRVLPRARQGRMPRAWEQGGGRRDGAAGPQDA